MVGDMPPLTRASFAHDLQAEVLQLPSATAAAVCATVGDVWDEIAGHLPNSWIEEATYNALTNGVRRTLGDEATLALFRRLGRRIVKNPNLANAVGSLAKVFGVTPHTSFKFVPRARGQMTRNAGDLTYERVDENHCRLILKGFPPSTFRSGTTVILLRGTWLGVLDFTNQPHGTVTVENLDIEAGSCVFDIRW